MKNKKFLISLLALGISSVPTQMIIIRETMATFSGNELVIGIIMGIWLIFTAIGSALGISMSKFFKTEHLLCIGHIIIALIPFGQLVALRAFPLFWVQGQLLSLSPVILGSCIILLPYCLTAGAMIPIAGCLLNDDQTTSCVYITDICGDILGGVLFSLIFVYFFSHWTTFVCLATLNLIAACIMISIKSIPFMLSIISSIVIVIILVLPLDKRSLSLRFPAQELIMNKNTPFAQISITKSNGQLNVLQDAIPLFSNNDNRVEAMAHIPMSQVKKGANVLLIAGGVFGSLKHIIEHEPKRIDYVELDPSIVALDAKIDQVLDNPIIHTHIGDGRLFIKRVLFKNRRKYEVIILDLPDPENIQLNRFYTIEFFKEVKGILSDNGVLFFTLTGADNYLEEHALALNRSVYGALNSVFFNIVVLPGETNYYIASNQSISLDIKDVLDARGILTKWLVDYQLPVILDPSRISHIKDLLDLKGSSVNTDLSPAAFRHLLNLWIKKSDSPNNLQYIIIFIILIFSILCIRENSLQFITFSSGYTGIGIELSLLIIFQIIFGYAYLWISIYVTLFLIGSLIGAISAREKRIQKPINQILICDIVMIVIILSCLFLTVLSVSYFAKYLYFLIQYLAIPLIIISIAITVGYQFVAVSKSLTWEDTKITGKLYLSDLAGASLGTFLISLIFLPSFGIIGVLASVLFIKLISLVLIFHKQYNYFWQL